MRYLLGLWLLLAPALPAEVVTEERDWLRRCRAARILYLGERHDSALDHQIQMRTLQGLDDPVVLAEMFQLPSAAALDDYREGRIDDQELRRQSEWDQRWGHSWEAYLPIWQLCRQRRLPLLPLRPSSESSRKLGREGEAGFSAAERQGLAPPPYEFGPGAEQLRPIFTAHAGPVSDEAFQRFVAVQVLWEEFMAARIRQALCDYPGRPLLVLVGKGHLVYGQGLPQRVQRHWQSPLAQATALVQPDPAEQLRADFWLFAQPAPEPAE